MSASKEIGIIRLIAETKPMRQKSDKPPKYLLDSFFKHMDVVFTLFKCMPYGSSNRLYNAYRIARKEYERIKKYKDE